MRSGRLGQLPSFWLWEEVRKEVVCTYQNLSAGSMSTRGQWECKREGSKLRRWPRSVQETW